MKPNQWRVVPDRDSEPAVPARFTGGLANLPVSGAAGAPPQVLGALARFSRNNSSAVASQYDLQTVVQINATTQDRDLGAVADEICRVIAEHVVDVPDGSRVLLLGQVRTMEHAFSSLL